MKVKKVYATVNGLVVSTDEDKAKLAHWKPVLSSEQPEKTVKEIEEGIFARTLGVLSKDIATKRVLVVGVGSVGSYIAEQLVRSGVGALTLIDPDIVEYANLSRTNYNITDVSLPKVNALAKHLLNINPSLDLLRFEKDILDFSGDELSAIIQNCDLILATTDEPQAQRILNRFAYKNGKPALFIGLYKGAEGGEIILSIPDRTPCYQCATTVRHQLEEDAGQVAANTDYGTGRLQGEVALGADIHHVTSAAVKIILALLIPEDSEVKLKNFINPALDQGLSYLTFSMVDQYWFYPFIFNNTSGQYAYQSVWLTPERRDDCPVCGDEKYRSEITNAPLRGPGLAKIRKEVD